MVLVKKTPPAAPPPSTNEGKGYHVTVMSKVSEGNKLGGEKDLAGSAGRGQSRGAGREECRRELHKGGGEHLAQQGSTR